MDGAGFDEEIPAGPGLPGFVRWLPWFGWLFVGLAAFVGAVRLSSSGILRADSYPSTLDWVSGLVWIVVDVATVLIPVVLVVRRPAACTNDRLLAIAAIALAAGPILRAIQDLVWQHLFDWLVQGGTLDPSTFWSVSGLPGWLAAVVAPFVLVRGLDRLDDLEPARFAFRRVAVFVGIVALLSAGLDVFAVLQATANGGDVTGGWMLVDQATGVILTTAWAWVALAALAGVRASRGRWWSFVLANVILGVIVSVVISWTSYALALGSADGSGFTELQGGFLRAQALVAAAAALALVGAFASVPRAPDEPYDEPDDTPDEDEEVPPEATWRQPMAPLRPLSRR